MENIWIRMQIVLWAVVKHLKKTLILAFVAKSAVPRPLTFWQLREAALFASKAKISRLFLNF